jgi:hypothetical protein
MEGKEARKTKRVKKMVQTLVIAVICSHAFEFFIKLGNENISLYEKTCLWLLVYLCVERLPEGKG